MAKQTFTTGQVLTAAQMTSLQQTAMLGGAANAKTASYVLVAADAGDAITMSNASATTITVNTGLFAAGDIVTIINLGAGVSTITAGTATVSTSGSLALAQNQGGVLRFTSASAAIFFQFATPASGDIEGVTAGTGISGGGTSGTVTITNSMATAIDAKGDLIVGTGADAFSRLAVGTNGQVLTADSNEATGLKFATPSGSSFVGCSVYKSGTQSLANDTVVTVTWDSEYYDTDAIHSTSSDTSRFTVPAGLGGKWELICSLSFAAAAAGAYRALRVLKNGTGINFFDGAPAGSTSQTSISYSNIFDLVATDYIEVTADQNSGGTINLSGGTGRSFVNFTKIG